jgi:hypothetical protein
MGDVSTFESIIQLSEIIGLPRYNQGQKTYLFGRLLVGDEIQVWGRTLTPWSRQKHTPSSVAWPRIKSVSLIYFYGIALGVSLILLWLTFLLAKSFLSSRH